MCCLLFGVVYEVTLVKIFEIYVVGISLSYRWFDGFLSYVLPGNYRVITGILPDYLQSGPAYGKVH